jgi:hypothetical protein
VDALAEQVEQLIATSLADLNGSLQALVDDA